MAAAARHSEDLDYATAPNGCPDVATLARWLAGNAASEADTVEEHFLQCPACQQAAGRFASGDELVAALGAVQSAT